MKRASLAGPVIKSLIFIVITVTVTAVLGISIAHSGVSATVGYQAVFTDVTGLNVGDDVDIAGVRVGDVTSISVYGRNHALVGFAVQSGPDAAGLGHRHDQVPQPGRAALHRARPGHRPGGPDAPPGRHDPGRATPPRRWT